MDEFSAAELLFFQGCEGALPLYGAVRSRVLEACPAARIEVKKTQISFFDGHMFAAVSFAPVGRAQDRPKPFLTLTLGLPHPLESPRLVAATEPCPGRWTNHILLGKPAEADEEVAAWLWAAADFAHRKGKKHEI